MYLLTHVHVLLFRFRFVVWHVMACYDADDDGMGRVPESYSILKM